MANEEQVYFYEVDFKTWKKYLEGFIEKQKWELALYINSLKLNKDSDIIEHIKRRIVEIKKALFENVALLEDGKANKNECLFYITSDGVPVLLYIGKERKREYLYKRKQLRLMYV